MNSSISTVSLPAAKSIYLPSLSSSDVSPIFVELDLIKSQETRGKFTCTSLGDLSLVRASTMGKAFQVSRSAELIKNSKFDNLFLCMPVEGQITVDQNGHQTQLKHGEVSIIDASRCYSLDMPGSLESIWISLPRARLESRLTLLNSVCGMPITCNVGLGKVATDMVRSIFNELPKICPQNANAIANNLIDMLSLTLSNACDNTAKSTSNNERKLLMIQRFIETKINDLDLSLQLIADEFSVSTRYIRKIFEKQGITPTRWIIQRRLEECYRALQNPALRNKSIADIAYSNGFNNICSFNKCFKSQYNRTPNQVRKTRLSLDN